ncbi:MAG TPA: type I-B CRISPR-associated protein Cas7/Cst2/DevR [Peptococcaceae bacterium]|jgi:CRISPR-associated protein Cst2|uniref:CRISPR-associated protein Cas7/Cst2/DevR n=1 Tax=anaerobic digester metagenome TaxID=1263854 RepID=A0A485LUX2_9ZZZZ|nr:type I-B CRISPR-associated protein Cas7/Cst2/DevR [Peptococcaceae bacterium]
MTIKGLTATVVFESSAVNRDDKLAGNITSIKKISRWDGTYSFFSRAFIRHHMFATLCQLFSWEQAPLTKAKDVIQFDFPAGNIVNHPEIDVFGFMNTTAGVVRKAPLGITKAISLEPWQADMAFYCNHDMVQRLTREGEQATPNPFQKEEHHTLYRVSFTLDLCRLGYQEIYAKGAPKEEITAWIKTSKLNPATEVDLSYCHRPDAQNLGEFNWYRINGPEGKLRGVIGILENEKNSKIVFLTSKEEFQRRVEQLLTVIKDGLVLHSSTENYGVAPIFIVLGALKVPVPLFNSAVLLDKGKINAGSLNQVLDNNYIVKAWYDGILPVSGSLRTQSEQGKKCFHKWCGIKDVIKCLDSEAS